MYPDCICQANNYIISNYILKDKKFAVIQCKNCGLSRTWPKPIQIEESSSFYDGQDDFADRFEQLDLWKKFIARSLKNIKRIKPNGKLLEIGCNMGIFIKEAIKEGYDAYGYDISARAVNFGIEKLQLAGRLKPGILDDVIRKNERYDIVVYIHVLEHIDDIVAELNNAQKVLNPQGLVAIEVPNYKSFWPAIIRGRWYGFSPSQHIWQFSRKPLENILTQLGYKIVYSSTRSSLYHKLDFSFGGVIKLFIYIVAYIFNIGDSLVIIAQKNES